MQATVKIDKFGRVLIPKTLRERLGLTAGDQLSISLQDSKTLSIKPITPSRRPRLTVDDFGIPVFEFGTDNIMFYDFTEAVQRDRDRLGQTN